MEALNSIMKQLNQNAHFRKLDRAINAYFETNLDAFLGGLFGVCFSMMFFTWFTMLCIKEKITDYQANEKYIENLKMTYPGYAEIRKIEKQRQQRKNLEAQLFASLSKSDREKIIKIRADNRLKNQKLAEQLGCTVEDLTCHKSEIQLLQEKLKKMAAAAERSLKAGIEKCSLPTASETSEVPGPKLKSTKKVRFVDEESKDNQKEMDSIKDLLKKLTEQTQIQEKIAQETKSEEQSPKTETKNDKDHEKPHSKDGENPKSGQSLISMSTDKSTKTNSNNKKSKRNKKPSAFEIEKQEKQDNIDRQKLFMFYLRELAKMNITNINVFSYTVFYPSDHRPDTPGCIIHERRENLLHVINKKVTNFNTKTTRELAKRRDLQDKYNKNYLATMSPMPLEDRQIFKILHEFRPNEEQPVRVKIEPQP